jgi:hypothetical protein
MEFWRVFRCNHYPVFLPIIWILDTFAVNMAANPCLLWFLASIPIALALLQGKETLPSGNGSD